MSQERRHLRRHLQRCEPERPWCLQQKVTISSVQRQFKIGYSRATRLIELLEAKGIVSGMDSDGGRSVLRPRGPQGEQS
ncbi:DNA translocase FtsK [Burkholderia cenocepacia]|uniref:DNA translocase FtsK n=1 Tax=Burkholderia cenocepacia TaxID=95486 RepID=UPI002AB7F0FB|nr:DNA translocase FtsK [Burkholderia cenocepacia]